MSKEEILPYNSFNNFLKKIFQQKTYKISLDAGFSCPNRDGSKGFGGCIFCDEKGSSSRTNLECASLKTQIINNIKVRKNRYKAEKFIVYFQSFTNTYAPVAKLKKLYDEAIEAHEEIVGISVSTRPDCVDEEKIQLLASYKEKLPFVCIEYGMQTSNDTTLKLLNRNETHGDFLKALELTKKYDLHHCAHVILGLPGESLEDNLKTADTLAELKVEGVKIHCLVAMENSVLGNMYEKGLWTPLSYKEYVESACSFIERIHPDSIIHRVSASGHPLHLIAPLWMKEKNLQIANALREEFQRRKTRQGSFCLFRD